jgi:plastocyanin
MRPLSTALVLAVVAAIAAVAVAVAAAAGPSPSSASPRQPAASRAAPSKIVRVGIRRNRFHPRRVVVRLGQRVRWRNRDPRLHTVVSQDLGFNAEAFGRGKTFTYRTRRRGTFDYFCTLHLNQEGVLVVR